MAPKCKCNPLTCECCRVYIPQRWLGFILCACSIMCMYGMRNSTSITIVRMVKNTSKAVSKSTCVAPPAIGKAKAKFGENDWSQNVQAWILAAFFLGYFPFHFPSGIMADKFGSRWVLTSGVLLCSVCTFLIPISTDYIGYVAVIILRVLQGSGQAALFTSVTAFLGRWAPLEERSLAASVAYSGTPAGSIGSILLTGILIVWFDNWRAPFYFWGSISILISILLILYLYSDPTTHPHITEREAEFLKQRIPRKVKKEIPYCKMALDGAIIATMIGQIGHVVVLFFFATSLPKYMDNVLRYPVANNAIVSSLPYFATIFASLVSAKFADWGIKKKKWDVGCTRKILSFISNAGPGFFLLGVGYCGCDDICAMVMVIMSMLIMGPWYPGMKANTLDLTSQYAGWATALSNGTGAVVGAILPHIISQMAPDNTVDQWIIVFWVFCATSTITTIIFVFMASGKRRRWDYSKEDQKYFEGRVPCFTLWDGIDKDRLAVEAGRAADTAANP